VIAKKAPTEMPKRRKDVKFETPIPHTIDKMKPSTAPAAKRDDANRVQPSIEI